MAWEDYNEFLRDARETFGLSQAEAQELYRDLREELDDTPTRDDLDSERAVELAEAIRDFEGADSDAPFPPGDIEDLDQLDELLEWADEFYDGEWDGYDLEAHVDGDTGATD